MQKWVWTVVLVSVGRSEVACQNSVFAQHLVAFLFLLIRKQRWGW